MRILRKIAAASAMAASVMSLSLLFAGCAGSAPQPDEPAVSKSGRSAADYQPLGIGNRWTYKGVMLGQPVERTVTTLGIEKGFFVDDANGRMKIDQDGLRDDKRYLLKSPVAAGHKWMAVLSMTSTEHYEIIKVGVDVTTPAGKFEDCAVVRGTNRIDGEKTLETEWTFAPGIGIVRMATNLRSGGKLLPQGSVELTAYRIEGR